MTLQTDTPRSHADADVKHARMIIGGREVEGKETFPSYDPFTGEVWATVPNATAEDVDDAVQAARSAFTSVWRDMPGVKRAALMTALAAALEERAEQFGTWETTDNGKVIRETRPQMTIAARNLRFFAGYADKIYGSTIPLDRAGMLDYTQRLPFGAVALITPWNSPISVLSNKLPAALATGNTVVIKPSEHASVTTCEFGRLALEVGFPPGVINVVTGAGDVGEFLTSHPGIKKISFTGSPRAGERVAGNASRNLVPTTMELGGKCPNIVFDDADLDQAVVGALAGIFAASGQTCIAGSRLLVQRGVYEHVVEAVTARAATIKMGDPLDPATEMGPAANRAQYDRILQFIRSGVEAGASLTTGGDTVTDDSLSRGFFVPPTVFRDVEPTFEIAREEIFGPVLCIMPFADEDEAVEIANSTAYGLASGVWTQNLSRAHRVTTRLESGVVWINTYRMSAAQAPIGGTKRSGYGRERGEDAMHEYTWVKNVMLDYSGETRDPFVIRA